MEAQPAGSRKVLAQHQSLPSQEDNTPRCPICGSRRVRVIRRKLWCQDCGHLDS